MFEYCRVDSEQCLLLFLINLPVLLTFRTVMLLVQQRVGIAFVYVHVQSPSKHCGILLHCSRHSSLPLNVLSVFLLAYDAHPR